MVEQQINAIENAKIDKGFKSLALSIEEVLENESGTSEYTYGGDDL